LQHEPWPSFLFEPRAGAEALIIVSAPEFNRDAEVLAALAVEAKLPTVCEWSHMAAQGCLFGYGPSQTELRRRTADFLVRIFRGSAPGDLPIEGPTRFQFAVNLKTAKRLGVELPTGLLLRADEVIEGGRCGCGCSSLTPILDDARLSSSQSVSGR
jgi:ABC-type uncharacterized transport system substrate-binding protein